MWLFAATGLAASCQQLTQPVLEPDANEELQVNPELQQKRDLAVREIDRVLGHHEVVAQLARARSRARHLADPCAAFDELAPQRAKQSRWLEPDEMSVCDSTTLKHVYCLVARTGYFIPVKGKEGSCNWSLWHVPRGDDAPRLLRDEQVVTEFTDYDPADFSAAPMFLEDMDGDGVEEVVISRGWEHAEGVGSARWVVFGNTAGRLVMTPFTQVKDVDGDGHTDGIVAFERTMNHLDCDAEQVWNPATLTGPVLVAHHLAQGSFVLNDEVSGAFQRKACPKMPGSLEVRDRKGTLNENAMATRAVCRVLDGEPLPNVASAINAVCQDYDYSKDCPKPRRNSCIFKSDILGWLDRVAQFPFVPNFGARVD